MTVNGKDMRVGEKECPLCKTLTAVQVGEGHDVVWTCLNGCDLTHFMDCEQCAEWFNRVEFAGSLCGDCLAEEEEEEDA